MPAVLPVVAVLDDEAEMRKAFRRLLGCHGYQVREYSHAEDLITDLTANPPGCIILDLHMPGANGFDVLEALGARNQKVPTIVVTAHDEPGTELRVRALGAVAYLKKPVDRDTLLASMESATSHGDRACNPAAGDVACSKTPTLQPPASPHLPVP